MLRWQLAVHTIIRNTTVLPSHISDRLLLTSYFKRHMLNAAQECWTTWWKIVSTISLKKSCRLPCQQYWQQLVSMRCVTTRITHICGIWVRTRFIYSSTDHIFAMTRISGPGRCKHTHTHYVQGVNKAVGDWVRSYIQHNRRRVQQHPELRFRRHWRRSYIPAHCRILEWAQPQGSWCPPLKLTLLRLT